MDWCEKEQIFIKYKPIVEILQRKGFSCSIFNNNWDHVIVHSDTKIRIYSINDRVYILVGDIDHVFYIEDISILDRIEFGIKKLNLIDKLSASSIKVSWGSEFQEQKEKHFSKYGWFDLEDEQKQVAWAWLDDEWGFPDSIEEIKFRNVEIFNNPSHQTAHEIISEFALNNQNNIYAFNYSHAIVGLRNSCYLPCYGSYWMIDPYPNPEPTYFIDFTFQRGFFWIISENIPRIIHYHL